MGQKKYILKISTHNMWWNLTKICTHFLLSDITKIISNQYLNVLQILFNCPTKRAKCTKMHLTAPLLNKSMNLYASYKEMHPHKNNILFINTNEEQKLGTFHTGFHCLTHYTIGIIWTLHSCSNTMNRHKHI